MSGTSNGDPPDRSRGAVVNKAQSELNRQALVDLNKRMAEIELKMGDLLTEMQQTRDTWEETLDSIKSIHDQIQHLVDDEGPG